jgi:hypothetical protein
LIRSLEIRELQKRGFLSSLILESRILHGSFLLNFDAGNFFFFFALRSSLLLPYLTQAFEYLNIFHSHFSAFSFADLLVECAHCRQKVILFTIIL